MCVSSSDFANDVGADSVPKKSENSMALILSEITEEMRRIVFQMKDLLEDVESLQEVVQHRRVKLVPIICHTLLPISMWRNYLRCKCPRKRGGELKSALCHLLDRYLIYPAYIYFSFVISVFSQWSIRIISDFFFFGRGEGGCCKPIHMGRIFNKSPERSVQASIEPTLGTKGQCVHLFESTVKTSLDLNIFLVY